MNNNSGDDIDVTEIALYFRAAIGSVYNFMAARDLLGSQITIPNTGQFKVTYEIALVMPA